MNRTARSTDVHEQRLKLIKQYAEVNSVLEQLELLAANLIRVAEVAEQSHKDES